MPFPPFSYRWAIPNQYCFGMHSEKLRWFWSTNSEEKATHFLLHQGLAPIQIGGENLAAEWSINYNTILQLDLFCKRERKWGEVPYVQCFWALRENRDMCVQCKIDPGLLAALFNAQQSGGETIKCPLLAPKADLEKEGGNSSTSTSSFLGPQSIYPGLGMCTYAPCCHIFQPHPHPLNVTGVFLL